MQNFKVVLVTPEIIKDGELLEVLKAFSEKGKLERIVFDEAHTVTCQKFKYTFQNNVCSSIFCN